MILDYRENNRADSRTEFRFEFGENIEIVSVGIIDLCDDEHLRLSEVCRKVISLFRADLNARLCGNGYHHRVCCGNSFVHSSCKVEKTRCIEKIYFYIIIFKRKKRRCKRCGRWLDPLRSTRFEKKCFGKRSLS